LLNLADNLNFDDPPQIYGTAFNKKAKEIDVLKREYFDFDKNIPKPINESLNCKELLENYF